MILCLVAVGARGESKYARRREAQSVGRWGAAKVVEWGTDRQWRQRVATAAGAAKIAPEDGVESTPLALNAGGFASEVLSKSTSVAEQI